MSTHLECINAALASGRNLQIPGVFGAGGILWAKCDRLRLGKDGSPYVQRYGRFKWWLFKNMLPAIVQQNGLAPPTQSLIASPGASESASPPHGTRIAVQAAPHHRNG